MLFLILFTAVLLGHYSGVSVFESAVSRFHAYPMIFLIFVQFFLGFLYVVFPRFLMQAVIKPPLYMQSFFLYLAGSLLYLISLFIHEALTVVAMFILLGAQIRAFMILFNIQKKSIVKDKNDTKWVLMAFSSGITAHLLFIISQLVSQNALVIERIAINAGFYLFLFTVIFAISQRMIPLFTQTKIQGYVINKSKYLMEAVFGLLLFKVVLLSFDHPMQPLLNVLSDLPLLILFTRELIKWKLPFTSVPAIIWVLYLALAWILFGFFLSVLESLWYLLFAGAILFEKIILHAFALGYFLTILIGFGTRVVLGHSGRTPTADTTAVLIFVFVQVVVLGRIFAGLSLNVAHLDYTFWINVSAMLMLMALIVWSARYLKYLVSTRYIP